MNDSQTIPNPNGVTVFGSAIIKTEPDVAEVSFSVSRTEQTPKEAFEAVRKAAKESRDAISAQNPSEIGTSRIYLHKEFTYHGSREEFKGYSARIEFQVKTQQLDGVEALIIAALDSGANEVSDVSFTTSDLQQLRKQARSEATWAARIKAVGYCEAAGVEMGDLIHIEDVNPEHLTAQRDRIHSGVHGHLQTSTEVDTISAGDGCSPSAISVAGAVTLVFSIGPLKS